MKNKNLAIISSVIVFLYILIIFVAVFSKAISTLFHKINIKSTKSQTFNIISSSENQDLEDIIQEYANQKGYNINIEYDGTLDIIEKLNNGEEYDAVWLSNSIWMYMLDDNVKVKNSKYTSINPVIFGVTKKKAEELGFIGKTVYTKDIVDAISSGNLKFSMSNPTSTNSGASAYLGLLSTLAGNPEVLKEEDLQNNKLKENLKTLFSGMERSSGSEEFLEELFLKGDYEAVITYESSIISLNKKLTSSNKNELYAIYPVDGVSISDSPLAYIDNSNDLKREIFEDLQSYILSNEGQNKLQQRGRRTWYGGINDNVDKTIFNPSWGIDTTKYISPVKYPSTAVIMSALNMYQIELRKPVHIVFCLDYSGSMNGNGNTQLVNAMEYILTEKAKEDFIQFSEYDKIDVIPFRSKVLPTISTDNGTRTSQILKKIKDTEPSGSTALYPAVQAALEILQNEDFEKYNVSVVLMTDGKANVGSYSQLQASYSLLRKNIPIYSIMFGNADEDDLTRIANLTNAKVFDGKKNLVKAFKEVRGYN